MPRAGLDRIAVIEAAAALIDREGSAALSLARLAVELGVKPPSLYNHIDGLDGLERGIAISGLDGLAEVCRSAAMGRSGDEGLRAVAYAYRAYAVAHPGVYPLTQVARPDDPEFVAKGARVLEPVLAILSSFGLMGDDLIHAARYLRSALHGFACLESSAGFGIDLDPARSFEWMVDALATALDASRPPPG